MKSKFFFGLIFILIGLVIALESFNVISGLGLNNKIIIPSIFLLTGILILVIKRNILLGGMISLFASINLAANWFEDSGKLILPGVFIIIGLEIIFGSLFKKNKSGEKLSSKEDKLEITAILGGVERKIISQDFKGGNILALLGGVELDLTEVIFKEDIVLYLSAYLGGIELKLPAGANIRSEVNGILGGVELKNKQLPVEGSLVIYLKGTAFMGGIEIN